MSGTRGRGKGGKGYGKGGAKRHRRVLRDNIQGITKPAIRRLARRGGVKRISGLIYDETRGVLKVFLENIIRDAVTYTEHARRKTVVAMDIVYALKRQGRPLYGFGWGQQGAAGTARTQARQGQPHAQPRAPPDDLPTWDGVPVDQRVVTSVDMLQPKRLSEEERTFVEDNKETDDVTLLYGRNNTGYGLEPDGMTKHLLNAGSWLCDDIMAVVIRLLQTREQQERLAGRPFGMFFGTQFIPCMQLALVAATTFSDNQSSNEPKILKKALRSQCTCMSVVDADAWGASEAQLLFFPVSNADAATGHKGTHWSLVVADMGTRTLYYVDSLAQTGTSYLKLVKAFLDCLPLGRDGSRDQAWTIANVDSKTLPPFSVNGGKPQPKQRNDYDCGVFMLLHMDSMALQLREQGYAISQRIITNNQARERIAHTILLNNHKRVMKAAQSMLAKQGKLFTSLGKPVINDDDADSVISLS